MFLILLQLQSQSDNGAKISSEWKNLMDSGMKELKGDCQCCANHGLSLVLTASNENGETRFVVSQKYIVM